LLLLLALALSACKSTMQVEVRALVPAANGRLLPAPGVPLVALPYDRDSVIAALEARAPSPRPSTALLDSLFRRFRPPFAAFAAIADTVRALQDSLTSFKAQIDSLSRESPEYRKRYGAFLELTGRRAEAERRQAAAQKALTAARSAFGPRADSVRAAVRAWEDSAYSGYEKITAELARKAITPAVAETTMAGGAVSLPLPRGRWWIYARSWDANDPNAEWYWNVPVTTDSVVLSPDNAQHRTRY
jgi:hypothetical protein